MGSFRGYGRRHHRGTKFVKSTVLFCPLVAVAVVGVILS